MRALLILAIPVEAEDHHELKNLERELQAVYKRASQMEAAYHETAEIDVATASLFIGE
jgi:hypothetical protein